MFTRTYKPWDFKDLDQYEYFVSQADVRYMTDAEFEENLDKFYSQCNLKSLMSKEGVRGMNKDNFLNKRKQEETKYYLRIVDGSINSECVDNTYSILIQDDIPISTFIKKLKWGTIMGLPQLYIKNYPSFGITLALLLMTTYHIYSLLSSGFRGNYHFSLIIVSILVGYLLFSFLKGYFITETFSNRTVILKTVELKGLFSHTSAFLSLDLIFLILSILTL